MAASSYRQVPHYDSGRTHPYHPKMRPLKVIIESNLDLAKPSPVQVRVSLSGSFHTNPRRTKPQSLRRYTRGAIIMFETAVQEKRTGIPWGTIMGVATLAGLLGAGYMLIT